MNFISFVVDGLALHYYQAELLLFSLNHFSRHPKENIFVHCTNRVDGCFLKFLERNNYPYKIIEPFLDGKYCNKIKQLDTFYNIKEGNLFLLDTDMFALEALSISDENKFCAKIVDAENPPLSVMQKIFRHATVEQPEIVHTDWDLANALTIASNFNGGFYYIPQQYIKTIADAWKKWATWLFARPELFENISQAIHTDQVSMALALCESQIPYQTIASNYNCPIHHPLPQKSLILEKPIILLHYHQELNCFGLLKIDNASNKIIKESIEKANHAIAKHNKFEFFSVYRKRLIRTVAYTNNTEKLHAALLEFKAQHNKPLKIILHAGTPKTGTTSIQFFLAQHQIELKNQGYLYPSNYSNTSPPKHQWLVAALINNNVNIIIDEFDKIFLQLDSDINTIILSTEGIYNHWFDFSQEAKSFLTIIAKHFELNLWIWFREPLSFIDSFYRQNLKNPKMQAVECYGQDWSLEEMLANEWFTRHLDYIGFVYEIEYLLGKDKINIFSYQEDIIPTLCHNLSLEVDLKERSRENFRFCAGTVELLRIINKHPLSQYDKTILLQHLTKIDSILSLYQQQHLINETNRLFILEVSSLGVYILKNEYHINLI